MLPVVPQSFESMLFYILYYVWENFLRIIPMNCFRGTFSMIANHPNHPIAQPPHYQSSHLGHLGHLGPRFSGNSGTRCWRRRWGKSSTVPQCQCQCAAVRQGNLLASPKWPGRSGRSGSAKQPCPKMAWLQIWQWRFWRFLLWNVLEKSDFSGWSHSHAEHTNQSFSRFKRDCKAAQRWQQSLNLEDPLCVQIRATEGQLV